MNKTKIDWTDYTWNPITGCTNGCEYCYARRLSKRLKGRCGYPLENPFAPTFHPNRLNEPTLKLIPSKIFTVSMGDMFDKQSSKEWTRKIMDVIKFNKRHTFQILTKQPEHMQKHFPISQYPYLPDNLWLGVSVDKQKDVGRIDDLTDFRYRGKYKRFVSFEPLRSEIRYAHMKILDWVIIGSQTGNSRNKIIPKKVWIDKIKYQCDKFGIPVWMKENLKNIWNKQPLIQEFPE